MTYFPSQESKGNTICIVASSHHGIEPTAHQIAAFLSNSGWSVTFLDVSSGQDLSDKPNYTHYKKEGLRGVLGGRPWFATQQALSAYHWLKDKSFDVILFHAPVSTGFFCCQAQNLGLAFGSTALWVLGDALTTRMRSLYNVISEDPRSEGEGDYLEEQTLALSNAVLFTQKEAYDWSQTAPLTLPKKVLLCERGAIHQWLEELKTPLQTEPSKNRDTKISIIVEKKSDEIFSRLALMLNHQTQKPFQIIIIGDQNKESIEGATWLNDNTIARAEKLNKAASIAEGTHLLFLDEDDVIEPDMIELFSYTSNHGRTAILSSITGWSVRNDNELIAIGRQKVRVKAHEEALDYLSIAWIPYGGYLSANLWENVIGEAVLIEKDTFLKYGGFNQKHGLFLMWGFLTTCMCKGEKIKIIPEVLISFARNKQKYGVFSNDSHSSRIAVMQETLKLVPKSLQPALCGNVASFLNLFRYKPGATQVQDGAVPTVTNRKNNPFSNDAQIKIESQTPQIALCASESYIRPLCVTLASIFTSTKQADVHIITSMSEAAKNTLLRFAERFGRTLNFVSPDYNQLPKLPKNNLWGLGEVSIPYLRICLAELLPTLSRIIYMDADILVRHDLSSLWHEDLQGLPLGAVIENPFQLLAFTSFSHVLAAHIGAPYFNGGVLVMDLDQWREENFAKQVFAKSKEMEKEADLYKFGDQGPLNLVFKNRWRQLPVTWNFCPYAMEKPGHGLDLAKLDQVAYQKIHADPALVHFLGPKKPWSDVHERTNIFFREYEATLKMIDAILAQNAK